MMKFGGLHKGYQAFDTILPRQKQEFGQNCRLDPKPAVKFSGYDAFSGELVSPLRQN
jgi:hypothetical protein